MSPTTDVRPVPVPPAPAPSTRWNAEPHLFAGPLEALLTEACPLAVEDCR